MARKKKNKSTTLRWLFLGFVTVGFTATVLFGYHYYSYIFKSNIEIYEPQKEFIIHTGWSFEQVTQELKRQGFINNVESFIWVAKKKNYPNRVKSGKYTIHNHWSNAELVDLLRSGKQTTVNVSFNNITRLSQLATVISKQIEADSTELMSAFLDNDWLKENGFTSHTIRAIFIPNTYNLYWNTSGTRFRDRMYREYKHFWNEERKLKANNIGLMPVEVSILASIVEAETKKIDEMPIVAGLYLNRLSIGKKLQSDPTVVYALGEKRRRVYTTDLEIDSPYNTYKYSGLPPGPIGFPSTTALDAVLNHDKNNFLYMCAKPDYSGYHNFATNYSQHQRNASIYRAFLNKEGIK